MYKHHNLVQCIYGRIYNKDSKVNNKQNVMKKKIYQLSMLAILSYVVGCTPQDQFVLPTPDNSVFVQTERAYPGETGPWLKGFWLNNEVRYQAINGEAVIDGDMILHPHDLSDEPLPRSESTGRTRVSAKWPNKTVIYQMDPSVPNPGLVQQAIAHWQSMTPIRFVQRTNERAFVLIRGGSGCSANVGRVGVQQYVTLSPSCSFGSIVHELGHTVGLWHEQSRADRDNHIIVHLQNIQPGAEYNFQTYPQMGYDGFDHGTALDFSSIMMYSPFDFSSNGQPTITRKDGSLYSIQRNGLSPQDVATVNAMYP